MQFKTHRLVWLLKEIKFSNPLAVPRLIRYDMVKTSKCSLYPSKQWMWDCEVTYFSAAATPTYNLTIFSQNCRILSSLQKNASRHRKLYVRLCKLNSFFGVAIIKYIVISFSPLQCDDCMMQEKKTNYKAIQMDIWSKCYDNKNEAKSSPLYHCFIFSSKHFD